MLRKENLKREIMCLIWTKLPIQGDSEIQDKPSYHRLMIHCLWWKECRNPVLKVNHKKSLKKNKSQRAILWNWLTLWPVLRTCRSSSLRYSRTSITWNKGSVTLKQLSLSGLLLVIHLCRYLSHQTTQMSKLQTILNLSWWIKPIQFSLL